MTTLTRRKAGRQKGFTLVELAISMAILTIVMGVVLEGVATMQTRNTVETNKMDLTQEAREFMDQITNDLRQSGFPRPVMFDPTSLPIVGGVQPSVSSPPNCANYANLACGLINLSTTSVQFEGDVDGTGVSEEFIQLKQTNGAGAPDCATPPCVIQRGTISKAAWMAGNSIDYYTEVGGVMNTGVFKAYDNTGSSISLSPAISNAYSSGLNIRAIGITLYIQAASKDLKTGVYPTVTMVSTARVND